MGYNNFKTDFNAPRRSYLSTGQRNDVPFNGYQRPPKHSGAKFGEKNGTMYVNAWKKSKRGFLTLFAWPYNKSQVKESKSGKEWISMFVTIVNKDTLNVTRTSGMYDIQRKRLYLKEFNMIVTRNGAGGYWGKHISKSYNR